MIAHRATTPLALVLVCWLMRGPAGAQAVMKIEPEIAEATVRYQIAHNASTLGSRAGVYCVAIAKGRVRRPNPLRDYGDPEGNLLAAFQRDARQRVKGYSQCKLIERQYGAVSDRATGRLGILLQIDAIRCATRLRCEVDGGYWEGLKSASGNTYYLEKRSGSWSVLRDVVRWTA